MVLKKEYRCIFATSRLVTHFCCGHKVRKFARGDCDYVFHSNKITYLTLSNRFFDSLSKTKLNVKQF